MKTNGRNSARYRPGVIPLAGGSEWEISGSQDAPGAQADARERERDRGGRSQRMCLTVGPKLASPEGRDFKR